MPEIRAIIPTHSTEPAKLRVCAYARVSSDSDDQLNSFFAQVKHYTDFIGNRSDWEFVDIYADEGITGTRADKRDDFQRLLNDCRKGKIDLILTKSISRFSRNQRDCIKAIRELQDLGIAVEFEKEHLNTGKISGEMLVTILSMLAQQESESISGNMRLGYQMRMKNGNFITCCAPYGYNLATRDLVINEDEAEVVRRIFRNYLSGKGFYEIAAELTKEKIKKWDGTTDWHYNTVSYILQNEKYIGDARLQKSFTTDTLPYKKEKNRGQKDQYYVQNSQQPIIGRAEFEQVQDLIARKRTIYCPPETRQYPLTKKIRCGECGHAFKRKVTCGITYWVCYTHDQSKDLCGMKQIPESEIYEAFIRLYNKLQQHCGTILIPALEQFQALQNRMTRDNAKLGEINKKISGLHQQNLVLNSLHSKGYMDSAVFMEQVHKITQETKKLRDIKRNLFDQDEDDQVISDLKNLVAIIAGGSGILTEFNETIFHSIVENVIAVPEDKIRFRLLGGLEFTEPVKRSERHEKGTKPSIRLSGDGRENYRQSAGS